jgi:MerR family transcriptional regulator, light-induced transcriptional regulator
MPSLNQSNQEFTQPSGAPDPAVKRAKARPPRPRSKARSDETAEAGECLGRLTSLIEGEIVPRLMLVHRLPDTALAQPLQGPRQIAQADIDVLARMAMSNDVDNLSRHVDAYLAEGAALEVVFADLLGGAARRLGVWWEEDRCSFVDVTIGLGALHRLVHDIARRLPAPPISAGHAALFATLPGEQHCFGLRIIDETFRTAGWRTQCEPGPERGALLRMVKARWFDLFGLSLITEADIEPAAALIRGVRRASMNAGLCVIVGGRILEGRDDLVARTGADISATRGNEAVERAQRALSLAAEAV